MPSAEQILSGLKHITVAWGTVAIFWHAYFAAIALALLFGLRPPKRLAGFLLVPPLLSVSGLAWLAGNPFNGMLFAVLAVLLLFIAYRLGCESVRIAPAGFFFPGLALFAFGWSYPHFRDGAPFLSYLYRAPTGLIPCPTLSIIIGLALALDGLGSRALCLALGVAGLFFGVIGVARLGVAVDWTLLLGAIVILARGVMNSTLAGTSGRKPA
jgi:hypothetical protein